jgi:osmotically inducible lipoprotein OsmB
MPQKCGSRQKCGTGCTNTHFGVAPGAGASGDKWYQPRPCVRYSPCPLSCLDSASLMPPFVKRIETRCVPVFFHHSSKGWRVKYRGTSQMKKLLLATVALAAAATVAAPAARADWVGAGAGAGAGLLIAGPIGAVAGGVIGGVFGRPFWGPSVGAGHCWTDDHLRRHCRSHT